MRRQSKSGGKTSDQMARDLRSKSELDFLRREVQRLRKLVDPDADPKSAPGVDAKTAKPAAPSPLSLENPFLSLNPDDLPPAIEPEADDEAHFDPGPLIGQIADLTAAKQRLSRLYFQQLDENRRRAQKLHLILENISGINAELELNALLGRLASTIRDSLGFGLVLIRLREPGTSELRASAFAGIDAEPRQRLESEHVDVEAFLSWLKDEFRISHSYFISHTSAFNATLPAGYSPGMGDREDSEWHPDDVLLVPLFNRDQDLIGYVSVDDPEDRLVPSHEVIETLEIYGHHAVVAIENARLYRELERHTRSLEESQRQHHEMHQLKSNFLQTVSHELRTPISAIRAFVDTLLGAGYGEISHQQMRHFLSIINEETQRLSRLIESLLDLNRFDSGITRLSRQPVDLSEIVQETLQLIEPVAQVGRVSLKVDVRCADTRVDASRDQMRQLALHLGSNAVKFTPAGGSVTFVLTGDDRELELEVVDTGIGIPRESLERIFERFYQVDSSLVRRYGGTGLGLAICKSIIDWHGGRIRAESAPGQGSRFMVSLPRKTRPRVIVQRGPTPEAAAEDVLRLAIEMVAEVMGARIVSLLCPEDDGRLVIRAAMGVDPDIVQSTRVEPGEGVAGWVAEHRRPVCVSGNESNPEVPGSGRPFYRSRTFMSVPIEHDGVLLGVLNATDPVSHEHFDAEDCHLLLQLAQRLAAAWQQTLEAQEQQAGVAGTAQTLRQLLRHFERGRRSAPDRVRLARSLARSLDCSEAEIAEISFAASVHDVGMNELGEQIVEGAGTLNDDERRRVEGHPEAGVEMLAPLETAGGVRELVLSHHEWWDGSGYPRGLSGEDIPLGGRILAIVDAFESMTVGRAHRASMTREDALRDIARLSARQFDPRVVERLSAALEELESLDVESSAFESKNPE